MGPLRTKKKGVSHPAKEENSVDIPEESGVIIAHYGIAVDILLESGERRKVKVKLRSGHVVGDMVRVTRNGFTRLPRKTALSRRDSRGSVRTIGANLDILGVVVSPLPLPTPGYIDQAIVTARQAGLRPVLVINKGDIDGAGDYIAQVTAVYAGILEIFVVSAVTGQGLDTLKSFLGQGLRGFFVGVSGVGKSSLLNALCPALDLKVGEIYEAGKRGCNATTVSTLHMLADGGELVDTPGFNEFGLVDIAAEDLAPVFPGFETLVPGTCRFRNCRHRTEPGCALIQEVEFNQISRERYEAYLNVLDQIEAGEARFKTRR